MNTKDRKRLEAIYQQASDIMNGGPSDKPLVTNVDVIEALLGDIAAVLNNREPENVAKLVALDEAEKACKCPYPDTYHEKGCSLLRATYKGYTSDGYRITDQLTVWDYNLEAGYVNLERLGDDGWFEVSKTKKRERGSLMNDVRVCVRHPSTGQLASDALKDGARK